MNKSKYCQWFNTGLDFDDDNCKTYIFVARCCMKEEKVKRYSKRWKELYSDSYEATCPHCGRPITIACEMD